MRRLNRFFVLLSFTGFVTVYTPVTWANHQSEPSSYGSQVGNKALTAFANLSTGVLEIPKNIINTTNKSNIVYGVVGGLFKGLVHTAGRIGVGVTDLITLPLPTKPIAQPEYIWDDFDVDTRYGPVFRLYENHETERPVVEVPAPIVAAPAVVAPDSGAIDNSKQYQQETNQKLDTLFKKEMSK